MNLIKRLLYNIQSIDEMIVSVMMAREMLPTLPKEQYQG